MKFLIILLAVAVSYRMGMLHQQIRSLGNEDKE